MSHVDFLEIPYTEFLESKYCWRTYHDFMFVISTWIHWYSLYSFNLLHFPNVDFRVDPLECLYGAFESTKWCLKSPYMLCVLKMLGGFDFFLAEQIHNKFHNKGWWFGCHQFYFPRNIGLMSSSQLTDSYFSEGWPWPTNQIRNQSELPVHGTRRLSAWLGASQPLGAPGIGDNPVMFVGL